MLDAEKLKALREAAEKAECWHDHVSRSEFIALLDALKAAQGMLAVCRKHLGNGEGMFGPNAGLLVDLAPYIRDFTTALQEPRE